MAGMDCGNSVGDCPCRGWTEGSAGFAPALLLFRTLRGHQDKVTRVMWSPDGKSLASGSDDDTVKLWDASTKTLYHRWRDGARDQVQLLEAYACLLAGVLELYQVTLDAAEASGTSAAASPSQNPTTTMPGDGKPLNSSSREYARALHRILAGTFFEPVVPGGEGC